MSLEKCSWNWIEIIENVTEPPALWKTPWFFKTCVGGSRSPEDQPWGVWHVGCFFYHNDLPHNHHHQNHHHLRQTINNEVQLVPGWLVVLIGWRESSGQLCPRLTRWVLMKGVYSFFLAKKHSNIHFVCVQCESKNFILYSSPKKLSNILVSTFSMCWSSLRAWRTTI